MHKPVLHDSISTTSVGDQAEVLFLEQTNGAAKCASFLACGIENFIVLFFGNAYVEESTGTLLRVQQVNILGQRQNHIHGLALRRTGVRLQGDAQSEVSFFEIIGGFAKTNLSGFNVGTFRVRTDEGVWECPPAHRASSICSHHNICIQSIYPFGMRLLISRRLNLVYADVFAKWRLLRFLQQPLLLRYPGWKQQMKRTI